MIKFSKRIMKESECSVCGYPVMADEHNNGEDACPNCGWIQDGAALRLLHSPSPIIISLDKARRLYREGKPLEAEFDDFMDFYEMYGEVEFTYNNTTYGMTGLKNDAVQFWACNVPANQRNLIVFSSPEDFAANARIDGVLVKDLWDKIENVGPLK